MSFARPLALVLLAVPVLLAVGYLVAQRRRPAYAVRFTNLELLDVVAPEKPAWRRHVPAVALVAGLVALVVGLAGPYRLDEVPVRRATVILALDTSRSMEATDVEPDRLSAMKEAAIRFVDDLPEGVELGLVEFSTTASVLVSPTADRAELRRAVEGLQIREGTSIGEAIVVSLEALARERLIPPVELTDLEQWPPGTECDTTLGSLDPPELADPPPARIVVMTDGCTTSGLVNRSAIAAARAAGVPVSTIAFGTADGVVIGERGEVIPVPVETETLSLMAAATGGETYAATTAEGLAEVFEEVGTAIETREERRDLSPWFTAAALTLVTLAALGSLRWFSRLP